MKDSVLSKEFLNSLGILDWGYTEEAVPVSFDRFQTWISKSFHGHLSYLSDHRKELREDLKKVYPDFQSALVFLFSYQPTKKWMIENNRHEIAAYAFGFEGEDYHLNIKRKLKIIADHLGVNFNYSLDAQPILERDLAFRAGLGWFGKNSMLINRKHGSYFIIGSLILDKKLPLHNEKFEADHCGTCMACVDACPTLAIDPITRTLIAQKCISTFTIETMKEIDPPLGLEKSRGEIFGCDICQDVCPWNKKSLLKVSAFLKLNDQFEFLKKLFYEISKEHLAATINSFSARGWRKKLFGTPFDRPGKRGWLKNLIPNQSDSSKKRRDEP